MKERGRKTITYEGLPLFPGADAGRGSHRMDELATKEIKRKKGLHLQILLAPEVRPEEN